MNEQLTVVAKLVKATQSLGPMEPDKNNSQGRYDYISADKILGRCGKALADNGIMVIPSITDIEQLVGETNKGTKSYACNIRFIMTVTDGDSQYQAPWVGSGVDYGSPDKALYKAITSGHKYFLMKLFNIGVGNEDGEHENAPEQAQARYTPQHTNGTANAPQPDNPFEHPVISEKSLKHLHALGTELYGADWNLKRPVLVEHATAGRTKSSKELFEAEAQVLIEGMAKKQQQLAQVAA